MPKTLPPEKARQGRWGAQILVVLVVGLVLAGLVWLGAEFYGRSMEDNSTQQTESR